MKFLYLGFELVILTLYRSAGAVPVMDNNEDLRGMVKNLQVNFRFNSKPLESSIVKQNRDQVSIDNKSQNGFWSTKYTILLFLLQVVSVEDLKKKHVGFIDL